MTEDNANMLMDLMAANIPSTAQEMRASLAQLEPLLNADLPEVGDFHEAVPVSDGVTADVVVPQGEGPHPVLVYLHGGGWVAGSPATHRKLGYRFAEAGFLVLNVDYRMAPEHPFPTPFDDCVSALRWAHAECQRWDGDPSRMAVGGDSAGGNLSAAAAAALAGDPACPKVALLIYGVFDFVNFGEEQPSQTSPDVEMSTEDMDKMTELMVGSYLGSERGDELLHDPRVSPLYAAAKLPPSHVVVGSEDPLVAQAESLVKTLEAEGIEHEYFIDEGMPHGYIQMEFLPPTRPAFDRMVDFLRRKL